MKEKQLCAIGYFLSARNENTFLASHHFLETHLLALLICTKTSSFTCLEQMPIAGLQDKSFCSTTLAFVFVSVGP